MNTFQLISVSFSSLDISLNNDRELCCTELEKKELIQQFQSFQTELFFVTIKHGITVFAYTENIIPIIKFFVSKNIDPALLHINVKTEEAIDTLFETLGELGETDFIKSSIIQKEKAFYMAKKTQQIGPVLIPLISHGLEINYLVHEKRTCVLISEDRKY